MNSHNHYLFLYDPLLQPHCPVYPPANPAFSSTPFNPHTTSQHDVAAGRREASYKPRLA